MRSVAFIVPGVPVAKGRARLTTVNGHARAFTPARTVAYESKVAHAGAQAMDGQPLFEGPVRIELCARFQIAPSWSKKKQAQAREGLLKHTSRPDLDNILKAIGDGLNGVVWIDDSQVAAVELLKCYDDVPGVDVTVMAL